MMESILPCLSGPYSSTMPRQKLEHSSRLVLRNSLVQEPNSESQDASEATPESRAKKAEGLIPNARMLKVKGQIKMQHSLGVDFGDARTGIAISLRGFAPAPLSVTKLRGDKLVVHLLEVASKQRADEFIVGLPKSWDGKETDRSNKTRAFAGRLAQHAAERGLRVYLHDEYGTSQDALEYMIDMGSNKRSRKDLVDAYAAMLLLHYYFDNGGKQAELVLPKKSDVQERLFSLSNALRLESTSDDWDDN